MPKQPIGQTSFNAGEFSPDVYGRVDIPRYKNALKTATNLIIEPHGPVSKRPGSEYIGEVKTSANATRLVPFQFSTTDAFILEFGNTYIRFWRNQGQVLDGMSPLEITSPYTTAQLPDIQWTQFGDNMYFVHPDVEPYHLVRNSNTDWSMNPLAANAPPTYEAGYTGSENLTLSATSGNSVTVTAAGADFLVSTGTGGTVGDTGRYLVNTQGNGRGIVTEVATTTSLTMRVEETFDSTSISAGDWKFEGSTRGTIRATSPLNTVGTLVTIEQSATSATYNIFRPEDVGSYILAKDGVFEIVTYNSSSSVACIIRKPHDGTLDSAAGSASADNFYTIEESKWNGTNGYPRAVGLYEERLWMGGSDAYPQNLWASETGVFDSFGRGSDDDAGLDFELSSPQVNLINWIAGGRDLFVGTSATEFSVDGGGDPVTPSNIRARARTFFGSERHQVQPIKNEIAFIERDGKHLRGIFYNFNIDNYDARDLSFLAEHISKEGIDRIAYGQNPDPMVYMVLDSGDIATMTYVPNEEVLGWARYTTDGSYEDVAIIQNGANTEVWTVVNRTIDSSTARYLEVFVEQDVDTPATAGFCDSFIVYDSTPTATISGLDHLEGKTVTVLEDGAVATNKVVSSGSITLDSSSEQVVVGLPYTATLTTLPAPISIGDAPLQASPQRRVPIVVRVWKSISPDLTDENGAISAHRHITFDSEDIVAPLFSGDLIFGPLGWDTRATMTFSNSDPLPFRILAIFGSMEFGER